MPPKKIDLSTITIERIIVHDIPKHQKNDYSIEPNYSLQESHLTDGLRLFFKDKVLQALNSDRSFKICFDDNSDSTVSWLAGESMKSDGSLIATHSKEIAKRLFEIQVGNNAAGILVVIHGKVNNKTSCIILKLEMDKGAQLTLDPKTKSYDISEVENLMLTQKTRIYKVAMFILRDKFNINYDGIIMDYQIDTRAKKDISTWFMDKFLGCIAFEDPKVVTQKFYNLTRSFIDTISDPVTKAKYLQDLNSYVQKNSPTINPKEFAIDHLNTTNHRNDYRNFLESKRFSFSASPKDITHIERQIRKIVLTFENDIAIIGKKGTFKNKVKLSKTEDGRDKAEIVSKIQSIK
jgi:hypothetical protein